MLLYNYRVREAARVPYQWCYFGAADIPFNRVSIPSRFNPRLSPPGSVGICVEVTRHPDDARIAAPEAAEPAIRKILLETGVIGSQAEIAGVSLEHVRDVYPIYTRDYQRKRDEVMQRLSQVSGLHLVGRSGRFWYNNMDNSIEDAMGVAAAAGAGHG
jgi:protoporphyrinogen oxidase